MKILITGATGFIGTYICKILTKKNYEVYGTTINEIDLNTLEFNLIKINLLNKEEFEKLPEDIDVILHLASQQPSYPDLNFTDFINGNVQTVYNILDYYKDFNLKSIIYTSTTAILGQYNEKINESSPVIYPIHEYALSKLFAEKLIENFSLKKDFKSIILRFPSIYGKGQKGGIIEYFYSKAKENDDLDVFSMGKPLRNVIHIEDVIQSIILAIEKIDYLEKNELFLIGAEDSMTMEELAIMIIEKVKSKSTINLVSKETYNNKNVILDISKAINILKFKPMNISDGIDKYIKQMRD